MNQVDATCGECGANYTATDIILKDREPVCTPCRVEAASAHRPIIGMVLQATRFALLEKDGKRANLTALAFVDRLPSDYQTEARAAVQYVYDNGRATPLIAKLLKRDKIARVA